MTNTRVRCACQLQVFNFNRVYSDRIWMRRAEIPTTNYFPPPRQPWRFCYPSPPSLTSFPATSPSVTPFQNSIFCHLVHYFNSIMSAMKSLLQDQFILTLAAFSRNRITQRLVQFFLHFRGWNSACSLHGMSNWTDLIFTATLCWLCAQNSLFGCIYTVTVILWLGKCVFCNKQLQELLWR